VQQRVLRQGHLSILGVDHWNFLVLHVGVDLRERIRLFELSEPRGKGAAAVDHATPDRQRNESGSAAKQ
jgi:hypothetical protein